MHLEAIKVTSDRKSWCLDSKCWCGGAETGKDRDNWGWLPPALNVTSAVWPPRSPAASSQAVSGWHILTCLSSSHQHAHPLIVLCTYKQVVRQSLDTYMQHCQGFKDSLNVSMHSQYLSGYLLISTLHCFCCNQQPTQILILYQNLQICDFVIFSYGCGREASLMFQKLLVSETKFNTVGWNCKIVWLYNYLRERESLNHRTEISEYLLIS